MEMQDMVEAEDTRKGRKRKKDNVDQGQKKQKTKEEKAVERRTKAEKKKEWAKPLNTIDDKIDDFIVRHANQMKRFIEATYK